MKTCQAKWGQGPGGWELRGRQLGLGLGEVRVAPAALRALVDDDVTTAQSEFWELGDGACSENGLRPGEQGATRAADPQRQGSGAGWGCGPRCLGLSSVLGKGWWEALRYSVSCLGTPAPNPGFQTRLWPSRFVLFVCLTQRFYYKNLETYRKVQRLLREVLVYSSPVFYVINTLPYLLYHVFPSFFFFSFVSLNTLQDTLVHVKGEYMFTVLLWQSYHMVKRMNLQVG